MSWLLLALAANFSFSVANIVDQILRKRHVKHNASLIVIWMASYFFLFLMILPFVEVSMPPLPQLAALLAAGAIIMVMIWAYVYAISHEEISRVMPMFQFNAVFALILSIVFLGEILTPVRYAGFAVLFLSGLLLVVERVEGRFRMSTPLVLMLGASVFLAVSNILVKYAYETVPFWTGYFWFVIGNYVAFPVLLFLPGTMANLKSSVKFLRSRAALLIPLTLVFTLLGDLAYLSAIDKGPVSLVSVVGSTQVAMLFLMTLFLSRFFPGILRERTDRKTLLTKAAAIALMVVGLFLLNGGA